MTLMDKLSAKDFFVRGNNLAIITFICLIALGLVGELFIETEFIDKLDDMVIILIAVFAIIWFLSKANSYKVSYTPMVLAILVFLTKVAAFIIEFSDKDARGDEMGLLLPLAVLVVLSIVFLAKSKKMTAG